MAREKRERGSPGAGAGRREETNLPHITWPQLRRRYFEATTFEERLGPIHAARRAIVNSQLDNAFEEAQRLLERIRFLTEIGNEVDVTEADPELRWQARIALVRTCIPSVLRKPTKMDRHLDEGITNLWRASAIGLVAFFAASEAHCNHDLDGEDRKRVHDFLDARWTGCTQPDDEDQRAGGLLFSRDEAGLLGRPAILRALVNTRHYQHLTYVWDAVPYLYGLLSNMIFRHHPLRPWPVALEWFPEGLTTREIERRLSLNELARSRFWLDHSLILQDCGFVFGRISGAEPIARALLELLAKLHNALFELQRSQSRASATEAHA